MDPNTTTLTIAQAAKGVIYADLLPVDVVELTAQGAIIHRPSTATFIYDQWYAIAGRMGLDADAYQLRAYLSGWYAEYERPEFKYLKRLEIGDNEDGWMVVGQTWYQPVDARYTCQWSVEFVRDGIKPTHLAERTWPAVLPESQLPTTPEPAEQFYPDAKLALLDPATLRDLPRAELVIIGRTLNPNMMLQYMNDDLALHTVTQLLREHQMQLKRH